MPVGLGTKWRVPFTLSPRVLMAMFTPFAAILAVFIAREWPHSSPTMVEMRIDGEPLEMVDYRQLNEALQEVGIGFDAAIPNEEPIKGLRIAACDAGSRGMVVLRFRSQDEAVAGGLELLSYQAKDPNLEERVIELGWAPVGPEDRRIRWLREPEATKEYFAFPFGETWVTWELTGELPPVDATLRAIDRTVR